MAIPRSRNSTFILICSVFIRQKHQGLLRTYAVLQPLDGNQRIRRPLLRGCLVSSAILMISLSFANCRDEQIVRWSRRIYLMRLRHWAIAALLPPGNKIRSNGVFPKWFIVSTIRPDHTSEQSPLCSDVLLFQLNKRTSSARSPAPPLQTEAACAGLRFGFKPYTQTT